VTNGVAVRMAVLYLLGRVSPMSERSDAAQGPEEIGPGVLAGADRSMSLIPIESERP